MADSPFTLKKSQLTDEKKGLWCSSKLTGDLNEVPGVGKATIEKLVKEGIHNTWQLIGDMLKHVDGEFTDEKSIKKFGDKYWNRLVRDFASPAGHAHTVIHALVEKVSEGFRLPGVPMPASAITDDQWNRLRSMKNAQGKFRLSGDISEDIFTIGPALAKKLNDGDPDNIENTWQLVGLFLEFYTGDAAKDLAAFELKLKSYSGLRVREVAAQMVEIIGSGIQLRPDYAPPGGRTLDFDSEDSPGKPVRLPGRTNPPKGGTQTSSNTSSKTKERKKPQSSFTSTAVMAVIALVLLLFIKNKLGL